MLIKIIYIFHNSLRLTKMYLNKSTFFSSVRKKGNTLAHVKVLGFSEYFNGVSSEFACCVFLILDKFSSKTDIDEINS